MELVCQNLKFLRNNIQEARSGGLRNSGISDSDVEKHESDPKTCTDEVLERYCHFYKGTGVVPDIFGRLWPERLRTKDLTQQWHTTRAEVGYHLGDRPYREP